MKGYGNFNSGDFYGGSKFKVSPEVDTTSVATTEAITVASGMLVLRSGIWVTAQIKGDAPDIDIGYGSEADMFFDALASAATNKVIWAPGGKGWLAITATTGPCSAYLNQQGINDECHGKYFNHPDTIDVDVNTAASRGSLRVIAEMLDITEMD